MSEEESDLDRALEKFIISMRLFIPTELNRRYGDDWERRYLDSLNDNDKIFWEENLNKGGDPFEGIDFANLIRFSLKQKIFFGLGASLSSILFFFSIGYASRYLSKFLQTEQIWRKINIFIILFMSILTVYVSLNIIYFQ